MSERVAIVGSREHPKLDMVRDYVRFLPEGTVIVSGGADGVDSVAVAQAKQHSHLGWDVFPPSERIPTYGAHSARDRLLYRNTLIALDCNRMVVFPDGSKGGCWDAAREAVRFRRPVEVRWADGRVHPFPKPGPKLRASAAESKP